MMLLHITPRLYLPLRNPMVELIDVALPQLGLTFNGSEDLHVGRPYPHQNYYVAGRQTDRENTLGFLVEADSLASFSTVTRWSVNASHVLTHTVQYQLAECELDAVTDEMLLWAALCTDELGEWSYRYPLAQRGSIPLRVKPCMDLFTPDLGGLVRCGDVCDVVDQHGMLSERTETFLVPTIESTRLKVPFEGIKLPDVTQAFVRPLVSH